MKPDLKNRCQRCGAFVKLAPYKPLQLPDPPKHDSYWGAATFVCALIVLCYLTTLAWRHW